MPKKVTTESFIQSARAIHGDKYDYGKSMYQGAQKKLIITCPIHGEFLQQPNHHLRGAGCSKCTSKSRLSTEEFIRRAREIHGNTYDYSEVVYSNAHTKVTITCKEHGKFNVTPASLLNGRGCTFCVLEKYKKSYGSKANFDLNVWVKQQRNRSGLYVIEAPFKALGFTLKREFILKSRIWDFFIPELNLLLEIDGKARYGKEKHPDFNVEKQHKDDQQTVKSAKKKGYKVARLPYWLSAKQIKTEIYNILIGSPTFPDVPDLDQAKTKPKPSKIAGS